MRAAFVLIVGCLALASAPRCGAQAVKLVPPEGAGPPPLTYHGLLPGIDSSEKVRSALGEPVFEARWYNRKLYYPAAGRPGLIDVVHLRGGDAKSPLAGIEAASVPEGLETGAKIRDRFGEPEYELRMATWTLLDYSAKGLRFALSAAGETIGVAYFAHGRERVPEGSRKLVDMSGLRQGPQPAPARPASLGDLQAGASEVVFSPQGAEWLAHSYTIHDDLKARTIVFRDGDLTVALVGADLFGMGWDEINVIRERANRLGVDHTVVAMSHNHAAGDTIGVYGHYPVEYIAHIQNRIVAGIEEAIAALQPVKELRTASRELPMDGIRVMDLFRNARNPGVLDPQIALIQAIGQDSTPIATLVHFACHTESLSKGAREISADFPGYMCERIKAEGGGQAIFMNGALGGMVSGDNRERTHASSRDMGLKLAEIVMELAKTAQPPAEFRFRAQRRAIQIPMMNPNFKALYDDNEGLRRLKHGRVQSDMILIELGEAQIVTLPGELLPEVSFEILEKMNGFPRMLIGLANDELGYMVPPYDYRDDAYEETMSQGPSAALIVRDTALMMLQGVR